MKGRRSEFYQSQLSSLAHVPCSDISTGQPLSRAGGVATSNSNLIVILSGRAGPGQHILWVRHSERNSFKLRRIHRSIIEKSDTTSVSALSAESPSSTVYSFNAKAVGKWYIGESVPNSILTSSQRTASSRRCQRGSWRSHRYADLLHVTDDDLTSSACVRLICRCVHCVTSNVIALS
jgi:hypothetical protein